MPSNLYLNEKISFIAGRNFTFAGVEYKVGDEFDQELAPGRIEQLVRTRHIYPVVDDRADKTRFFHREVHVRADIERVLSKDRGRGQIVLAGEEPPSYDSTPVEEPVEDVAEDPVVEEPQADDSVDEGEEPDDSGSEPFDPADHTLPEVREYLQGASEDERERVLEAERNGKARKGILDD